MIKSMTGYGKSAIDCGKKRITVEIKSVNSKQCDIILKSPQQYRGIEPELRKLITDKLERGKIEVYINIEYPENYSAYSVNTELYYNYHNELRGLVKDTQDKTSEYLNVIMRMPDILKQPTDELIEGEEKAMIDVLSEALNKIDDYRTEEGRVLEADFEKRVAQIIALIPVVEQYEPQRIETIRQKLNSSLLNTEVKDKVNAERFEQELVYYIEKIDFTEEKVRLAQHGAYFIETLRQNISNGKKLTFIVQEMGREINTLGSKANNFDIQKIVVEMKDELEKMKEQLSNIL